MADCTPGPWRVMVNKEGGKWRFNVVADDQEDPGNPWYIAEMVHGAGLYADPAEANARLLAAAPDLLSACKVTLCLLTATDDWQEAMADQLAYPECPYYFLARAIEKAVLDVNRP